MRVILLSVIAGLVGVWPQGLLADFDDGPGLGGLSQYVFSTYRSTVVQTGGIAGTERTFGIRGWFSLEVDVEAGTASLLPVDARLVDSAGSVCLQSLDDTFNLTQLAGTIVDGYSVLFAGWTSDGSAVSITLDFLQDGSVRLRGETVPPPNSADFFVFKLDALGRPSCPADGTCSSDARPEGSEYVVLADRSTVTRIAGCVRPIQKAFAMGGRFRLLLDFASGTARFDRVEGNLIDASCEEPNRPVDEVLNLSGLTGTLTGDGSILFEGQDFWNADVRLISNADGGCAYLSGRIAPPWTTTASPRFYLDVVAQRRYGGGTGEPNDPYLICTAVHLNTIGADPNDWDKHFKLTADIDLSAYSYDRAVIAPDTNDATEWIDGTPFSGVFDGSNHTISHLRIEGNNCLGLFGKLAESAEVKDLGVADVNIIALGTHVGALAAYNDGMVAHCTTTGTIAGDFHVGGLVGTNNWGSITSSHSTGIVAGSIAVGGLVGWNWGGAIFDAGLVDACYSTASVSGLRQVGGLVGFSDGTVSASWSSGAVRGDRSVGGLIGENARTVSTSYSTGEVVAITGWVGGLVGRNRADRRVTRGVISDCYSTGAVHGAVCAGGLVGWVTGSGPVTHSFWDTKVSGQVWSARGTGLTTAEMQTASTFLEAGWDFIDETENGTDEIWWILEGQDYPRLWWEREDEAPS